MEENGLYKITATIEFKTYVHKEDFSSAEEFVRDFLEEEKDIVEQDSDENLELNDSEFTIKDVDSEILRYSIKDVENDKAARDEERGQE